MTPGLRRSWEVFLRRLSVSCVAAAVLAICLTGSAPASAEPSPIPQDCFPPSGSPWYDEGPTDPAQALVPATGHYRAVMLFVDFPDFPSNDESTTTIYDQVGATLTTAFSELSFGKLHIQVDPRHEWYRMPQPSTYYGFDRFNFSKAKFDEFMRHAITAADADVDFSGAKMVYVVASKGAQVDGVAWISPEHESITVDGTMIQLGAPVGRRNNGDFALAEGFGNPVLIHETLHFFGLPDLYNNTPPHYLSAGTWDIMSQAEPLVPGLLAWHKWKLGWLSNEQVLCQVGPGTIDATLSPVSQTGGTKMVTVRTGPQHAYAIEARQATGTDRRLCETGVLVYKVDTGQMTGSDPGGIQLSPAQPDAENERRRCGYLYNAPFDVGADEVATFENIYEGVKVEVLSASGSSYNVRVSYTGGYRPPQQAHARAVPRFVLKKHVVASGALAATDGFASCIAGVGVDIQKKAGASWKRVKSVTTTAAGTFSTKLPDRTGAYRAVAKATDASSVHSCAAATSAARKHSH